MGRSGSVVSANSVMCPIGRPESAGIQENGGKHKGRKVSFMSGVAVKAKKFCSAAGAKIKNIFFVHSARRAAGQVPQREKPVISGPLYFTQIAGAGISADECRNPFLTEPVQTVAVKLIPQQSIDPRRIAELVADNPLVKNAAPVIVEVQDKIFGTSTEECLFAAALESQAPALPASNAPAPAEASRIEKFAHNGLFELRVDVPVYESVGPLRGSLAGKAHKEYDAKMSAFRFKPIKQANEDRAYVRTETQQLETIRNGISARIGAEG